MKQAIILIICVIIILKVNGQEITFNCLLTSNDNELVNDIYEDGEGNIYIAGLRTMPDDLWGHSSGLLIKLNKYGQLLDSVVYSLPNRRFCFSRILPKTSGDLIICGFSTDTAAQFMNNYKECKLEFKTVSTGLQVISEKSYAFPPEYKNYGFIFEQGLNGNILTSGAVVPGEVKPKLFIYEINENLDSLRSSFYFDDTNRICGALKQLNDSSIWIADIIYPNYYLLDKNLQLSDCINCMPHYLSNPYGLKWDTDTSFYLAGEYNGGNDHDIGIFKQFDRFDSTGSIFKSWGTEEYLDLTAYSALDYRNKDSIYVGGTTNFWFYYMPAPSWYFIIQTDSNLNVRWEKFYGGDAYYSMWKIMMANDGGLIIGGTRYEYQNVTEEELDIHVLKLNSEGLLVSTPEEPSIKMREALVFPNPGTNHLKVRIAAHYNKSIFELYDISGKIVLSEQIIGKWGEVNTVALKSGTYVYRIYNEEGLFESGKWLKQ